MWGLDNHSNNKWARGRLNGSTLDLTAPITTSSRNWAGTQQRGRRGHSFLPRTHTFPNAGRTEETYAETDTGPYYGTAFNDRLNALRISSTHNSNIPRQRDHLSRQYTAPELSLPSSAPQTKSASPPLPPPRNPRRQFPRDLNWRPASSIYEEDPHYHQESDSASSINLSEENNPENMGDRHSVAEISPPSSPDIEKYDGPLPEDVSPIDEEPSIAQQIQIRDQRNPQKLRDVTPTYPTNDQHGRGPPNQAPQNQNGRSAIPVMRRDRPPQPVPRMEPAGQWRQTQANRRRESLQHRNESHQYPQNWDSPEQLLPDSRYPAPVDQRLPFGSTTTITGPRTRRPSGRESPSFVPRFGRESPSLSPRLGRESPSFGPRHGRESPAPGQRFGRESPAFGQRPGRESPAFAPRPGRESPALGQRPGRESPALGQRPGRESPAMGQSFGRDSPSLGPKIKQSGGAGNKPQPLETRPPWNGASGRQVQVRPVRDEQNVRPLNVPLRDRKASEPIPKVTPKEKEKEKHSRRTSLMNQGSSAVRNLLHGRTRRKTEEPSPISSPEPVKSPTPEPTLYPPPIKTESPTVQTAPSSSHSETPIAKSNSPEPMAELQKPIKRKPAPVMSLEKEPERMESPRVQDEESIPDNKGDLPERVLKKLEEDIPAGENWEAPPSRFSITTYATSKADSPRVSLDEERPPLPTAPEKYASVMDRSRPVREVETYKSRPSEPIFISMGSSSPSPRNASHTPKKSEEGNYELHVRTISTTESTPRNRRTSLASLSKALPPAPPEILSANDRVENLNARLNGLALRRSNINKSIKQMTELMPQHKLMATPEVLQRREEEKEKVEHLREELANVQQEEYELGIKLHRANKRLAREAEFEPTGLWVRRIAN